MSNNMQSRKWALVINNPQEAKLDHPAIIEILHRFAPDYFCLADEISKTGTYHTHIFYFPILPYAFQRLKRAFRLPISKRLMAVLRKTGIISVRMENGKIQKNRKRLSLIHFSNGDICLTQEKKNLQNYSS